MLKVTILFVGLIAFHHDSDSGKFHALVVDARYSSTSICRPMEHRPFLSFLMEEWDYEQSDRKPDKVVVNERGREVGIVWLNGEDLTFDPAPTNPLVVRKWSSSDKIPSSEVERENLRWAISMSDLNHAGHDFGKLKPECLVANVGPPLVARMSLEQGDVLVESVGRDKGTLQYYPFSFEPDPKGSGFERALAGSVKATLEIPSKSLQILANGQNGLKLIPSKPDGEIELVVGNLPLDLSSYGSTVELKHFSWYYELVKSARPIPCDERPIPVGPAKGATSGSGVFCPDVQFP